MSEKHREVGPNLEPVNEELQEIAKASPEEHVEEAYYVPKPTTQREIRSLAFHLLYAVDRNDYAISLEEMVQLFREGFDLEIPDTSFAIMLAGGAIEQRVELDEAIKPLLKHWTFERLGCCTRLILRLALWELKQPHAAPVVVINEAIELAKGFAEKDAYKFVNGILDEYCKIHQLTPSE